MKKRKADHKCQMGVVSRQIRYLTNSRIRRCLKLPKSKFSRSLEFSLFGVNMTGESGSTVAVMGYVPFFSWSSCQSNSPKLSFWMKSLRHIGSLCLPCQLEKRCRRMCPLKTLPVTLT